MTPLGQLVSTPLGIDLSFGKPVFQNIGSRVIAIGSCSFDVDRHSCIGAGYINGVVRLLWSSVGAQADDHTGLDNPVHRGVVPCPGA